MNRNVLIFPVLPQEFPILSKLFPVFLSKEMLRKSLRSREFLYGVSAFRA